MVELSDEILVAYVDGQLDERTSSEVEAALASDPAAQETVRRFAESARLAHMAYDEALQGEVPERLLEPFGHEPRPAADVEVLAARRAEGGAAPRRTLSLRRWALPLAASLALFVGLGGGYALWDRGAPGTGPAQVVGTVPMDTPLHQALETTPSGQALAWEEPDGGLRGEIKLLLTFRSKDGHYCREYQAFGSDAGETVGSLGVACRGASGTWHQEISIAARPSNEGVYQPAGLSDAAFDAYLTELMSGAPLDQAAETTALESGWR